MSISPVLFLDVDGVLNNEATYTSRKYGATTIRRFHVLDGRRASGWCACLCEHDKRYQLGSTAVRGWGRHATPMTERSCIRFLQRLGAAELRNEDIMVLCDPEVTRYAIVDDHNEILPEQRPFFVQTNFKAGLLDKHVKRLAAILLNGSRTPARSG